MAFTGKAIYDTGVFSDVAEDVSDIVSMIAPFETPLLDLLGDADRPAENVLHQWLEDDLAPNTIVTSVAVNSTATGTGLSSNSFDIAGSVARFLQVGAILRAPDDTENAASTTGSPEMMQITAISGDTITVKRAFAGTSANSLAAGASLSVVVDAANDGADVTVDISRPRSHKSNYTQIIKRDIIISGTMMAMRQLGGITSEWDHQKRARTREGLRDLNKAVIVGRLSGNTIGSASNMRTFSGLLEQLSSNKVTVTTFGDSALVSSIKKGWDNGGQLDTIVCGDVVKSAIDQLNSARVRTTNAEGTFQNKVTQYGCTYGEFDVMLDRWMPARRFAVIARDRVKVVPLAGRSFQFQDVGKTGDSMKGMVLGEYSLEVRNQNGMVQGRM